MLTASLDEIWFILPHGFVGFGDGAVDRVVVLWRFG
jgi:hypothetical protein